MADHESISKTEDVQRPTPGVDLEANRVSSDYLSCEIPEGWEATYHGEGFSPLFRMSPKESGPRDDVWIDCEMGFDKDLHLENGWDTPESRLATTKSVYFSPHSIGCYFLTPLDYHTVEAHGCKCAIIQVATSNNVGLAFNIYPDGPRQPILHATFGSWNNDRLDEARELVDRLAKSICVYESDTPSYVRDLQECLGSQVDPDHLFEVIARYGSVLENIKKETPDIARFVKQAYKADQRTEHERLIAAVEEYAESNKSIEPYLELLADVADAQARYLKEDRANLDKLRQIVAETSKSSIFFPNSLPRDFRKLPQQEWEEVERMLAPSERMRTILSRIGIEWPDSDNVDDGNSDNDAVVPDLPTVMLTLLSDDYVFFQNNEISWSKGHHVIKGLQVNSPKQRDLATIAVENGFDDINDLLNYFIAFMREVEKDEALVVPKASISKALHPIVRRGDLTGITLANLAASMAAFRVLNDRPNNYTVIYDGTLADGIPHFFDLMCRLLWDLRLCMTSLKGTPFQVTFVRCRNLDLSQLLKGHVSRVNGAQDDPVSVTVSEEPAIGLEAVASKEPSVKLEAAKAEEAPADEEGPSVELQTPDVPTLVMSLLSDGYVSFEDSDIPRKKGHHAIAGVGVSEQKREDLALIARQNGFDDTNELIDYFVSALQEVEKDEAFFVPKKTGINKGLYRIVRKGDLTGITFANMANYTDSFRIKSEGPDAYQVEYSEPVAIGLPRFFGMVCRLIWDLRQCENAQRGIPFSVRFSRIGIEFNCIGRMTVWWEYPKVTFVDGAQDDPALVNVTSAPSTDLTEGIEIVGEQPAGAAAEADSMDIPATMLALLSNGYVSFGEKDLSWSKGNHVIRGLQIGSPVHPRLATLARVNGFKNTDDLLEHFMAFMKQVDKDEELIVPKASIAKALGPLVRRGDLTGITLVNLTASEAFRVINDSPNSYTVMYDDALADGIPHFFDLMCRLLWDLRQCVETLKDAPFQAMFTSCRNLDLSQLLSGSVSRVDGAQDNPGTVTVSEAPAIGLEVATAEEAPVDEEDPSVELQKPDLTQLLRGNVSRANGAQDNPSTVNVTKTPTVDLGEHAAQGAASTSTAKKAPSISEKRAGLEKVLDRLLTAATKYREASGALWQYEEDERTLEEMPAKKKRLEKKILSIQRKQQAISDELTANASRKHDLQEERKQLLSRADMLEEKAHELEEERGGLGFFSILRKSQINSALKTIASRQDEIRACTGQIDEELKSLAKMRKKLLKDIKEPEGKIAREQAKLEELLQEEKETEDRLENAEKSRGTLSTERSTAKGQRTKALKRYNDLISGQLFTSAEKKSDEYREMKELMASALTKLKEQGVTPTNRATFPTLEA